MASMKGLKIALAVLSILIGIGGGFTFILLEQYEMLRHLNEMVLQIGGGGAIAVAILGFVVVFVDRAAWLNIYFGLAGFIGFFNLGMGLKLMQGYHAEVTAGRTTCLVGVLAISGAIVGYMMHKKGVQEVENPA